MTIGNRIRFKRKFLKLTIRKLHEMTGLSVGNISDLENDKYSPSISSLLPLSQALECSIDWIITGVDFNVNIRESKIDHTSGYSEIECDIIRMFRNLDERDREDVFESIKLKYNRTIIQK